MIKSVKIIIHSGYCEVRYGNSFMLDGTGNYLQYEKDGVLHIESDPCIGHNESTVISIPYNAALKSFILKINDGAAEICPLNCKKCFLDIRSSSVKLCGITSEHFGVSMSRGNAVINNAVCNKIDIDCGYGVVDLYAQNADTEYSVASRRGMGSVTLNSVQLPRQYNRPSGDNHINVTCGMGTVNINT